MHKILLVTDIFGESAQLRDTLARIGVHAVIVSPYAECRSFANEADAYQAFLAVGGLDAYYRHLVQIVTQIPADDLPLMIGFSAGASALWRFICSAHAHEFSNNTDAWLYYGGQIRHELALAPKLSTVMRWSLETQFDVWPCHQAMLNKPLVDSAVLPYPHGFINPQSKGFIAHAAADFWMNLATFLKEQPQVSVA